MRIETNQMIAGYPARSVRQLMRETLGRPITPRWVTEVLGCSPEAAPHVLAELQREGWVSRVGNHVEPSLRGSALAQAKASPPLTRATAERLITEIVSRAKTLNRQKRYAYKVERLVVFGSYIKDQARPNDVDVAVSLVPRSTGDVQRQCEQRRRDAHAAGFRNMSHWAIWPKLEVLQFLKSRSRGLSIQEMTDWIENETEHVVIYRADATA